MNDHTFPRSRLMSSESNPGKFLSRVSSIENLTSSPGSTLSNSCQSANATFLMQQSTHECSPYRGSGMFEEIAPSRGDPIGDSIVEPTSGEPMLPEIPVWELPRRMSMLRKPPGAESRPDGEFGSGKPRLSAWQIGGGGYERGLGSIEYHHLRFQTMRLWMPSSTPY